MLPSTFLFAWDFTAVHTNVNSSTVSNCLQTTSKSLCNLSNLYFNSHWLTCCGYMCHSGWYWSHKCRLVRCTQPIVSHHNELSHTALWSCCAPKTKLRWRLGYWFAFCNEGLFYDQENTCSTKSLVKVHGLCATTKIWCIISFFSWAKCISVLAWISHRKGTEYFDACVFGSICFMEKNELHSWQEWKKDKDNF